jgi:TorA maturation chaperone TorD
MDTLINKIQSLNLFAILFCQPEEFLKQDKEIFEQLHNSLVELSDNSESQPVNLYQYYSKYETMGLLADYTAIFLGPSSAIAHPYSSVYFGEKTLMNDTTEWVLKFYNETGLLYDEELRDMPDNIVVELEFLYYLNFNIAKAMEDGDIETAKKLFERESVFIKSHFAIWVPKFCKQIAETPLNDFYTELAICLQNFTQNYKLIDPQNNTGV